MYKILGGDGKEYGPISADTLRQWIVEGRANAQTQVQREGTTDWVALGTVPEFALSFAPSLAGTGITPPAGPTMNVVGLVGFCLSIASITFGLCCCYGLPFSISGLVCSIIGLVQIRKEPERYSGRGLALAGVIISIASMVLVAILIILGVALNWADIKKDFGK